ncbi:uncharacterized protein K02A2.6-like [Diprion similis]|uniref:uncharacterized protein K02A2.6-like n=1 Tax=Diprion similis TaxID=362088 RepID=UPI001EF84355|nr:uncharacterized protein K02A2.6-like [Diprion similis]
MSSSNHTWIYSSKKPQLVSFLKAYTFDDILEYASVEELRKIIVKIYNSADLGKKAERSEIEQPATESLLSKDNSSSDLLPKKEDEVLSHTESQSSDIESTSSIEMEGEKWVFNPKKEDWEAYIERLELYLETKDITDERKKVAHLLTKIGPDMYKTIRDLCAPAKPKDKSWKEITDLVDNHQSKQAPNESIADFIARLKDLALHCNFADLNNTLRDQLVCGVTDHGTRVALFSEEKLTYEKAVNIATTRESALRNAKCTDKASSSSADSSIHHVTANQRNYGNKNLKKSEKPNTSRKATFRNNDKKYICFCCGLVNNHYLDKCRLRNKVCNSCEDSGKLIAKRNEVSINHINADPMFENVEISNVNIRMEIDSGAYVAAMSEINKNKYFPEAKLSACDLYLSSYGQIQLNPIGMLKNIRVKFRNRERTLDLYIMKGAGPTLMGRQWLKEFGYWPLKFEETVNSKSSDIHYIHSELKEKFLSQYPTLFSDKQGTYNGRKIKLVLKDNFKPIQLKPYHAPFALSKKITDEINRLVQAGNLEPVACSEWATPVIPVLKKNGQVRLCGNFKVTVNPNLVIKKHPIPIKEKIFKTLQVGQAWSQIDLTHAFMQFEVDEGSRDPLTIITEDGLYRYTKMPEGIASSPAECQENLEGILKDIPFTEIYIDNIYCTGRTTEEHIKILEEIFRRLVNAGLRVNVNKCDFFKKELEILGFLIDESGLKPAPSKISAVKDAPTPKNSKELKAFLGLSNFYERFLPDRAEHVKPLYDLCNKKVWEWTNECKKAFQWLKDQITSNKVLMLYDPKLPLVLACDASHYGLSAVLSHRLPDGSERPIAFASKIIPKSELHRAILDKEAGAIIFGFRKFYQYVYWSNITLKTDHEPLKYIFGANKNLSVMIQSRLIRWSYFLSGFTYDIEIVKSRANGNCDALSRLPATDNTPVFDTDFSSINYICEGYHSLDFKRIATETAKDSDLRNVINYLQVIIPKSLHSEVLTELHASHLGTVKMKQLARNYFWWPNINDDIEIITASCKICLESRVATPKVPLTPWPWPNNPWSRIHTDFLGPFHGCMFLLILDAHTKWPEIINMKNNTQADSTIKAFKNVFSSFGLPHHVVSDNGPQFRSEGFQSFLKRNGIKHSFSPPYYPATNGAAENFVQTFKDKVDKIVRDAWLMFKRELRTRFDSLKPNLTSEIEKKQYEQVKNTKGKRNCNFELGEKVYAKDYRASSKGRSEGTVIKKNSTSTFNVRFEDGSVSKRHKNQIIKTELNNSLKVGENASELVKCKKASKASTRMYVRESTVSPGSSGSGSLFWGLGPNSHSSLVSLLE